MVANVLGRSSEIALALLAVGVLVVTGGAAVADPSLDVVSAARVRTFASDLLVLHAFGDDFCMKKRLC